MTVAVERADLERFRDLVAQRLGLAFEEGKLDYLAEVLRRRIEDSGSREAGFYLQRLGAPAHGRAEFRALAEQLTVGESYFFRNVDHFRVFTELVLPACARVDAQRSTLDARRRPTTLDSSLSEPSVERRASSVERRRLRLLSAGSAAGEEPYTVAMLVREHLPELASGDVQILGIDVNPAAIERAKRAHYSAWSLRETPAEMRDRYFRPSGREFVVDPAIRAMVAFEERNLVEQDATLWLPGAFDVVFCRNVTMYFPPPLTQAVIARIARALVPGGLLFLGHAETLRGVSHDFHLRHTHETFYYERRAIIDDRRPTTDDRDRSDTVVGGRWSVVAQAPAQETPGPGTSWIEAIQGASERIAALAREGASGAR
jgi:chemotaxis protein methyltransferase CheR